MKKLLLSCMMLLGLGGSSYAVEYEIDTKFTSVGEIGSTLFMIVNESEKSAFYNVNAQNLAYDTYATAVTGNAYLWKLSSLAGAGVDALADAYTIESVKADGSSQSMWGQSPLYLNSGAPGGFNGCFVLGNGTQYGTDVLYGGAWEIEYVAEKGFALKNVARGGYFAGVNPAPTGDEPIYWTFCTIKEKVVEDTEDPGIPEVADGWTDMISNGDLTGDDTSSFIQEIGLGKEEVAITDDAGRLKGRGIMITSRDDASNTWDTQFFIKSNATLEAGTKLHVEFDYKASAAAKITTQAHAAPGSWLSNNGVGDVNCGLSWEHFSAEIIVKDDGFQSLAFNLNENLTQAIEFHFDNIVMWSKPNAIAKPERTAVDAKEIDLAGFKTIGDGATWDADTKAFTGECGFQWEDGLDLSQYQYLIVTLGKNASSGGYEAAIKDKNGKAVVGDQYDAPYMNLWFGQWNNHNCMRIDLEKLRTEQEFDIYNIAELSIKGGDGLVLGTVYASNTKPNNDKNWGSEDEGDLKIAKGADEFSTICLDFDAAIAGAYVYQIAGKGDGFISLSQYNGVLKAGIPYFFKSNDNASGNVYFYKATGKTAEEAGENNGLIGTFSLISPLETGMVVLNGNQLWTVDSEVSIPANKAYIDLSKIAGDASRGTVFLGFGDATGIEGVKSIESKGEIFNLNGQRLAQPTKGLNIIGGKKVMVK